MTATPIIWIKGDQRYHFVGRPGEEVELLQAVRQTPGFDDTDQAIIDYKIAHSTGVGVEEATRRLDEALGAPRSREYRED